MGKGKTKEDIKEMIMKRCFECDSLDTEIIGKTMKCFGCGQEFCIDNMEG